MNICTIFLYLRWNLKRTTFFFLFLLCIQDQLFLRKDVSGECVISSVLTCHNTNLKRRTSFTAQHSDEPVLQLRVTAQFYLESKGKYTLEAWGPAAPGDKNRREAPQPNFGSSFYMFFPPPGPALCKLGWPGGCLFLLRSSLWSLDLPLLYFHGLSPSLSFSHRHSGLLLPILNT